MGIKPEAAQEPAASYRRICPDIDPSVILRLDIERLEI
jgi:hypothetical protein